MSGVLNMLLGIGRGWVNTHFFARPLNTSASTGIRSATVTFSTDGTATATGDTPPGWFNPPLAGIGSAWSVRLNTPSVSTNTNITGMTPTTWYALSSPRSVTFANTSAGLEGTGVLSVDFSPDGGATVYNAGDITWDVGFAL